MRNGRRVQLSAAGPHEVAEPPPIAPLSVATAGRAGAWISRKSLLLRLSCISALSTVAGARSARQSSDAGAWRDATGLPGEAATISRWPQRTATALPDGMSSVWSLPAWTTPGSRAAYRSTPTAATAALSPLCSMTGSAGRAQRPHRRRRAGVPPHCEDPTARAGAAPPRPTGKGSERSGWRLLGL